ncbi:MAG: ABC transporter ATP-binding protein [Haloferacaceae archaeon]
MADTVLRMDDVVKTFPGGVVANDGVSMAVERGEIHGLLGENGAGKTTLMKVLYGLHEPDSGRIELNGEVVEFDSPQDAIERGVGMVHQHFMLIPRLSVVDNVILGEREADLPDVGAADERASLLDDLLRPFTIDRSAPQERIAELSEEYGADIDPDDSVWTLGVGEQQRLEIVKALYRDADVLVLDEPTAVLSPEGIEQLFGTLTRLADQGMTIIFISQKLDEITGITDRVTVLRDGRVVDTVATESVTRDQLASMMVGEEVLLDVEKGITEIGDPVLETAGLRAVDDRGVEALAGVDLTVREGEIVGIAGVSGNGQRELAECLVGLREPTGGSMSVDGVDLTGRSAKEFIGDGVAFIPEDRMRYGVAPDLSITHNLVMKDRDAYASTLGFDYDAARRRAEELIDEFDIKAPDAAAAVSKLSGGNIQKVILARELSADQRLLVANQPTRGVDVGAIEFIRNRLLEQCERGTGMLLLSEELDEILQMSDRILVMYEGEVVHEVAREDADRDRISQYMAEGRAATARSTDATTAGDA